MTDASAPRYVGFWARTFAAIIDTLFVGLLVGPLLAILGIHGADVEFVNGMPIISEGFWSSNLSSLLFSALLIVGFWAWRLATPGKMVIGAQVVDAATLGKPGTGQLIGRYFAYFVSMLFFGLGFLWVAFDGRKQGWHDKLAGTLVIKKPE